MYETIYIEKNKSTRTGVYFYENSMHWNVFLDVCSLKEKKTAVICCYDSIKDTWKTFVDTYAKEEVFLITEQTDLSVLRDFIEQKRNDYTFIVFADKTVMDCLYEVLSFHDADFSYICVPATSYALFEGITIRPIVDEEGKTLRKEIFPLATYVDCSLLIQASPLELQNAFAAAFRLAISYKLSLFEWMISNMYELTDMEEDSLCELLQRGVRVWKERIEKDTAKERAVSFYGKYFYDLLENAGGSFTYADLVSLSMVCQTYLSWKKELISMEEFYEIRDMFVLFGLSITETEITADELLHTIKELDICREKDCIYIRKLGKLVTDSLPSENLIQEALEQIYFNEESNE